MQKITTEETIMVNGVYITRDVLITLDFLQSDSTSQRENPRFSNDNIIAHKKSMAEVIQYILGEMVNKGRNENSEHEVQLLQNIYWVVDVLDNLKAPE